MKIRNYIYLFCLFEINKCIYNTEYRFLQNTCLKIAHYKNNCMRKQRLSLIQVLYLLILLNFTYCKTTSSSQLKITEKSKMFLTNHITKCNRNIKTMFKGCPKIFRPVCGYYKNCNGIGKTFSNSCLACSDKKIQYYTEGKCKIKKSHKKIKYNKCSPESRIGNVCFLLFKPVCGITSKCKHNISECQTYSNSCFACHDKTVLYYKDGPCIPISQSEKNPDGSIIDPIVLYPIDPIMTPKDMVTLCTDESRTVDGCSKEYIPVCGIREECASNNELCQTYGNKCMACLDPSVLYFTQRPCPEYTCPPLDERIEIKCYDKDRDNQLCTQEYDPVCGVTYECMYDMATCKTFTNGCEACRYEEINYHFNGKCCSLPIEDIKPDPDPDQFKNRFLCEKRTTECIWQEYFPVCGFKKGCDFKRDICMETFNNACEACMIEKIIEYSSGECPKSHACTEDMRNQICTEEYIGRCGMEYGCNPKSPDTCNNNFGTGCQACTNPEIEKYYDYECGILAAQSDKTIDPYVDTCEKYNCLDEDRNKICTKEYLGVCAHKSEDCVTDCQYTTGTFCQACQNPEVTWVKKGECE